MLERLDGDDAAAPDESCLDDTRPLEETDEENTALSNDCVDDSPEVEWVRGTNICEKGDVVDTVLETSKVDELRALEV